MAPTAIAVSIEEYLRTSYRPDVEYLDGELREKSMVGFSHGRVQGLVFMWFETRRREWGIKAAVDTRTQVTGKRVRLPDIVVVSSQEQSSGALESPPLIAIEVLSPADTYAELKSRAADLRAMGTENVWLIDPQTRTTEIWHSNAWQPNAGKLLQAVNSPMHIDLDWLWAELDD